MAAVVIQFHPNAFSAGGPLESFASNKHKAVWDMSSAVESKPHIGSHTSTPGRGNGTPNSLTIKVRYGSPSWLDTPNEFNKLPYPEIRAQIANAVEAGIIQVLTSGGAVATVADIRDGTVS